MSLIAFIIAVQIAVLISGALAHLLTYLEGYRDFDLKEYLRMSAISLVLTLIVYFIFFQFIEPLLC